MKTHSVRYTLSHGFCPSSSPMCPYPVHCSSSPNNYLLILNDITLCISCATFVVRQRQVHTSTHCYTHTHTHTHTHTPIYTCTHARTHTHICKRAREHAGLQFGRVHCSSLFWRFTGDIFEYRNSSAMNSMI
jgi:hypothetical protein